MMTREEMMGTIEAASDDLKVCFCGAEMSGHAVCAKCGKHQMAYGRCEQCGASANRYQNPMRTPMAKFAASEFEKDLMSSCYQRMKTGRDCSEKQLMYLTPILTKYLEGKAGATSTELKDAIDLLPKRGLVLNAVLKSLEKDFLVVKHVKFEELEAEDMKLIRSKFRAYCESNVGYGRFADPDEYADALKTTNPKATRIRKGESKDEYKVRQTRMRSLDSALRALLKYHGYLCSLGTLSDGRKYA